VDQAQRLLSEFGIPVVAGSLLYGSGHIRLPIGGDTVTIDLLVSRLRRAFAVRTSAAQV
jgi:hypothetical protein